MQFVSEPCSLSINGVIFGLTSTDLLFHMGAEEISRWEAVLVSRQDAGSLDPGPFFQAEP